VGEDQASRPALSTFSSAERGLLKQAKQHVLKSVHRPDMRDPLRRGGVQPSQEDLVETKAEIAHPITEGAEGVEVNGESPDGTETKPRLNVAHEGSEIKKEATVPECVMYVRGLQGTTSEEPQIKAALRELFAAAGEVGRIQLPSFREEGKLKGFGFVHFASAEQCLAAISMGKAGKWVLGGKQLQVRSLNAAVHPNSQSNGNAAASVGGVGASQKKKELPGMIVQPPCLLCRLEKRTCDVCMQFPTHPSSMSYALGQYRYPDDARLPTSNGASSGYYHANGHVPAATFHAPTFADSHSPALLGAFPTPPSRHHQNEDVCVDPRISLPGELPGGGFKLTQLDDDGRLLSSNGNSRKEAEELRSELSALLGSSCEEMERWQAERSVLELQLVEANEASAQKDMELARVTSINHSLSREVETLQHRLHTVSEQSAQRREEMRQEIEAELEMERIQELEELEMELEIQESGKKPTSKDKLPESAKLVSTVRSKQSADTSAENKAMKEKDTEIACLNQEVARLRQQLSSGKGGVSAPAMLGLGGNTARNDLPIINGMHGSNTKPVKLVQLVHI